MGTTAQKLQAILDSKSDIKDAIEAKGVSVGDAPFDEYASKIGEISGGAEETPESDVNFYDYTGFRVASYTIAEAKALTTLPTPPSHDGLTFQGWNWTLADIQSYNRRFIDIGANYAPTDGKCHIKVHIPYDNFEFALSTSRGVTTATTFDWGDGTTSAWAANLTYHTYTQAGDYDITVYPDVATDNLYLNLMFIQNTTITAPSIGCITEVNVAHYIGFAELGYLSCFISIPASSLTINGFTFLTAPVVAIPRAMNATRALTLNASYRGIISFPKTMAKVAGTNSMSNGNAVRLVLPEYTDGTSINAMTDWQCCEVISLPLSFKFTSTNLLNHCYKLRILDIVQGWIPSKNMTISGSNYWLTQSLVDFFTKLGTTSTAITLTLGTANLNKLTAEQKAIATNKGYTLA